MYRVACLATSLVCFWPTSECLAQAPTPVHAYELNSTLSDTFGGPDIVNNGGALGATGITFGGNQGPSLSSWVTGTATSTNYSIEMRFQIADIGGYRKLMDFQNRTFDQGIYNRDGNLTFYNYGVSGSGAFSADTSVHLILARDGATNQFTGYVNGAPSITVNDSSNFGVFGAANNIMNFFQDDSVTSFGEASAGFVDYIRIYDHAVSATEAAALFAVPEPSTMIFGASALLIAGSFGYRKIAKKRRRRSPKLKASLTNS